MIKVDKLSKIFRDGYENKTAVDSISFSCDAGQIFGLLGPNGAGKTTTLRILSTVLKPSQGTVEIAGFDVESQAQQVRHCIGFISGNTGIYDRLTPEETIAYFGQLYGMSQEKIQQRCEFIYDMFDMREFAHTLNSKLSTGMKQKVSIARTIVHDPPVLIFDEPTANLDIMVAKSVLNFIEDCRDRGKCIILSTHIMREAEKLCDKVGIIHHGKLLALGSLEELYAQTQKKDLEDIFFSLIPQNGDTT